MRWKFYQRKVYKTSSLLPFRSTHQVAIMYTKPTSVRLELQRKERAINDRYEQQLRQLQKAHALQYMTWGLYREMKDKLD